MVLITEQWIKERALLQDSDIPTLTSLTLPGIHKDKITFLGDSLSRFKSLRYLNLDRNALTTLDGLQSCQKLERLTLYYNSISNIKELLYLRPLTQLRELDLRLNPFTKSNPDYKLYTIFLLPSLQKLDERAVRESERREATLKYSNITRDDLIPPTSQTPPTVNKDNNNNNNNNNNTKKNNDNNEKNNNENNDDSIDTKIEHLNSSLNGSKRRSSPKKEYDVQRPNANENFSDTKQRSTNEREKSVNYERDPEFFHTPRNTPRNSPDIGNTFQHFGNTHNYSHAHFRDDTDDESFVKDEEDTMVSLVAGDLIHLILASNNNYNNTLSFDDALRLWRRDPQLKARAKKILLRAITGYSSTQQISLQQQHTQEIETLRNTYKNELNDQLDSIHNQFQKQQAIRDSEWEHKLRLMKSEYEKTKEELGKLLKIKNDLENLVRDLTNENKRLSQEIATQLSTLNSQQTIFNHTTEVITLLKEAHRVVISSNNTLQKELEDQKERENVALVQSKKNYEALKKLIPPQYLETDNRKLKSDLEDSPFRERKRYSDSPTKNSTKIHFENPAPNLQMLSPSKERLLSKKTTKDEDDLRNYSKLHRQRTLI